MAHQSPQPSILTVLPPETLDLIFSFLPTPSQSNLRLVSKTLSTIGAHHIVQTVHVMFTQKSFQNLLSISLHPILRKHVSRLFYEVPYLADYNTKFEFIDQILEYEFSTLDNMSDAEEHEQKVMNKAWDAFSSMYSQQEYLRKLNYETAIFSQVFSRFPILKSVQMNAAPCPYSQAFRNAFEPTHAIQAQMLDAGEMEEGEETGTRALGALLLASAVLPSKLQHLKAHPIHYSFFDRSPINPWLDNLSRLRSLDLKFEKEYNSTRDKNDEYVQLKRLLGTVIGLQDLRLCFDGVTRDEVSLAIEKVTERPVDWVFLVEGVHWKNLTSLVLQVVSGSEKFWTEFLEKHTTLKVLRWKQMWLDHGEPGGWERIFEKMRTCLRGLKEVEFGGIWGQEGKLALDAVFLKMDGAKSVEVRNFLLGTKEEWIPVRGLGVGKVLS